MKSDVVIIGAGFSGLATGALLAKAGKRVTILEKGNVVGGRANVREEKGFTLNYGAHGMYTPESGDLAEVMRRSGTGGAGLRISGGDAQLLAAPRPLRVDGREGAPGHDDVAVLRRRASADREGDAGDPWREARRSSIPALPGDEWVESKTDDPLILEFMMAFARRQLLHEPGERALARRGSSATSSAVDVRRRTSSATCTAAGAPCTTRGLRTSRPNGGAIVTARSVDRLEVQDGRDRRGGHAGHAVRGGRLRLHAAAAGRSFARAAGTDA